MSTFGKYRLIAELGHGGMADVFLAVAAGPAGSGFSKLTVIKRLRAHLADDPEFVAMLMDEARIAARLNHPNVVQTNEVGSVDNQHYIAMEYLDGQPLHRLQHRLLKDPTLPFTREMQYVVLAEALCGLHHAHELADYDGTPLKIVHRDVTPHNIFVTYEGQVKVVDFGIAKAAGRASETRAGIIKGKVRYMAPEQAIGQVLDRRADLFAVGIMLWEIAAGRRLWANMDDMEIVQALVSGSIPSSPRSVDPSVPEAIDRMCVRALASRAEERFATADEFRAALEEHLAETGQFVEAKRKLGKALSDTFTDKRSELKAVIEQQLKQLAGSPTSSEFQIASIPSPENSSRAAGSSSSLRAEFDAAEAPTDAYVATTKSSERSPRRTAMVTVLAGVLLLVGGLGWAVASRRRHVVDASETTASAKDIQVSLVAAPPNATIRLDGRDVGNAHHGRLARDMNEHRIEVSADGFVTRVETVRFDGDVIRSFALDRAESSGEARAIDTTAHAMDTSAHANGKKGRTAAPANLGRGAQKAQPSAPPPPPTAPASAAQQPPPVASSPAAADTAAPLSTRKRREIDTKIDPWGHSN